MELSQRTQAAVQIVSNIPAPSNGGPIYRFLGMRTRWMAGAAAHKKTLNKRVWICDICHKQIHVRKQISIRCNRIEHWVNLRCAGIRQAQYTDTWGCDLHRESRLTPHLHHPHHRNQNTDVSHKHVTCTRQTPEPLIHALTATTHADIITI